MPSVKRRTLNIGVLASGRGSNLQAIMDAIGEGRLNAKLCIVISDVPNAHALARARKNGITALAILRGSYDSKSEFELEIVKHLKEHGVELVCLAGFMRIVGPALLEAFPERVINIHPALLPSFRGLDAQEQAFNYGVKVSGCTAHFVDSEVDHGPIICQEAVEVKEDDTAESLTIRILEAEHRQYPRAIQMIAEGRVNLEGRRVRIT